MDDPQPAGETPWSRNFPATPDQVGDARRFLAAMLAGNASTADAVTCLSELATNAVKHSRSALPGGTFAVRMRRSGRAVRVEVTDNGGAWGSPPDDPEHGRGLRIVRSLSSRCGIILRGPRCDPTERTVFFEMLPRPPT